MLYKVLINTVKDARKLVPYTDEFYSSIYNNLINKKSEAYESIYLYKKEHLDLFNKTKTLSGIKDVQTDKLVFDFDSKDNVEIAFRDTKELINRLTSDGIDKKSINLAFSSNKGFHVVLFLEELIDRSTFESITHYYAEDLTTFDTKVSDEQRVFRLPLSFNPKSNKFKVPLAVDDFMQDNVMVDDIVKYATSPDFTGDKDILMNIVKVTKKFDLPKRKDDTLSKITDINSELISSNVIDLSRKPKHMSEAKFAIQEGFFEEGERNEACMILAATYRYLGYNKELAYNMIKATLRLRGERLNLPEYDKTSLWKEVINVVYSPTWKGGTFSEEEGLLKKTIVKYKLNSTNINTHELIDLNNVSDYFKDFALNIDKNTLKLGIEEIDKKLRITTGMLVTLLAAPGAGKSSIAMSILNTVSKNEVKSVFFSLDMSMQQSYQRLIQKHTGHQSNTIFENYKNNATSEMSRYISILNNEYKNVKFSFRSGLTVEAIREVIINEQNITGVVPKLVVVDYLECINGPFSDANANKAIIATQLKDIANQFNICVLLLVQPRLSAGGPAGELNSYTDIKGSSVIGEASAVVLTLSRPGFNPKNQSTDKYACITVVKNRMGELSSTDLGWDGLTGNVRSLDSDEKAHLEEIRQQIREGMVTTDPYNNKPIGQRYSGKKDLY